MFPKFRRQRINRLEPATLIELKQYIDSRLTPVDMTTVKLNPQDSCSAPRYEPPAPAEKQPNEDIGYSAPSEKTFPKHKQSMGSFSVPKSSAAPQFMRAPSAAVSLDEALRGIDESFSEMVMRKIDECGMTDAQCYKKAQIDRKLFSKLRGNRLYKPSRQTAVALAVALELSLEETKELLMKAGFALSHSSKFDIIIEFFISRGNYNRFEINEALYEFDQTLI